MKEPTIKETKEFGKVVKISKMEKINRFLNNKIKRIFCKHKMLLDHSEGWWYSSTVEKNDFITKMIKCNRCNKLFEYKTIKE